MKQFKKLSITVLIFGLLAVSTLWGEKITIVNASDPKHPTYTLSSISIDEAEEVTGKPSNGAKVIIEKDGELKWSKKSLKQIDKELGGDGRIEIRLVDEGWGTVPLAGKWKTTLYPIKKRGQCGRTLPTQSSGLPEYVTISVPFHPNQVKNPRSVKVQSSKWKRVAPNRWTFYSSPAGGVVDVNFVWKLTVLSKVKMKLSIRGHIKMDIPSVGLHRECTVTNTATLDYVK